MARGDPFPQKQWKASAAHKRVSKELQEARNKRQRWQQQQ